MTTVVDDKGFVNPPPPLEGQVFKGKVKDARGNMVTDKGANGAILAFVIVLQNLRLGETADVLRAAIASTR